MEPLLPQQRQHSRCLTKQQRSVQVACMCVHALDIEKKLKLALTQAWMTLSHGATDA